MKKLTMVAVVVLLGACFVLADGEGADMSIRFYDKRLYHLSSEPIPARVTVSNKGPYRFRLADDRRFLLIDERSEIATVLARA
jgi:hypothetical protein